MVLWLYLAVIEISAIYLYLMPGKSPFVFDALGPLNAKSIKKLL